MERIVAFGLLLAGIILVPIANSTVIRSDINDPESNLARRSPERSSDCSQFSWSFAFNCPRKIPTPPKLESNLWLEYATDLWFSNPFARCAEGDRSSYIDRFSNDKYEASSLPEFLKQRMLPSWSKIANLECSSSQQKSAHYTERLHSNPISLAANQQSDLPSKFPKLSRSSLIVSFPTKDSSFIPQSSKLSHPAPKTERIASDFGWRKRPYSNQLQFHQGIDYGAPYGSPVVAAGNGIVTKVVTGCMDFGNLFCGGQLGNWIEIDHGNGVIGTYGHLQHNSVTVEEGMKVGKNHSIARVGSSGWSTGAHLDFRLKIDGKHEDPMKYIAAIELN